MILDHKLKFFIYLIERYEETKNTTADKVLQNWDKLNLTNFIYDMYELYHSEPLENAFADIDKLIANKKIAG